MDIKKVDEEKYEKNEKGKVLKNGKIIIDYL